MTSAEGSASRPAAGSISGWIEAVLYALVIGLLSVAYAVASQQGAHVVVFILFSMLFSGLSLLAVAGRPKHWREIALHPKTWAVGITNIVMEAAYFMMFPWLTPAEANLVLRLSIPIVVAMGVVLVARRPGLLTLAGVMIATLAVASYVASLDLGAKWGGLAFGIVASFFLGARSFASEFHPHNRGARSITEKMGVTGVVVLVTALAMLVTTGIAMLVIAAGLLPATALVPTPAEALHGPTLLLALVLGMAVFIAMYYLMFSSTVKIRTENFIATGALMPLTTLMVQAVAEAFGVIEVLPFDWRLAPAMAGVILGVAVMIWAAGGRGWGEGSRRLSRPTN